MTRMKVNYCEQCLHSPICLLSQRQAHFAQLDQFAFPAYLLNRGEHLYHQGQFSSNLYIIRTGILKSYVSKRNGDECVMRFYLPPDLFGFESINKEKTSISVIALDQTNICVIPMQKIFELVQKNPDIGNQLLRMISKRISQDNEIQLRTTAKQRVVTFLLELNARYHQLGYPEDHCQLCMTHQDIANYLRIQPATMSRILHELENQNLIKIAKQLIYFYDIKTLKLMSDEK